jgi:hypothetical protein
MSLIGTGASLLHTLNDRDNRVVALSGDWGTGKSYLWRRVQAESENEQVKSAVYVSLFGLSSLSDLRLRVLQGALPKVEVGSELAESVKNAYTGLKKVLKSFHSGFSAIDELALIGAPMMLKGRFIVIDDIERKHEKLSIDEILGFIDDHVQNLGCRFLLILNNNRLEDVSSWEIFREKVIDQELRLNTTPSEAFSIAVSLKPSAYASHIRRAVETCNLANIRIIVKIIKAVNGLLDGRGDLPDGVLQRVIPSATLLSAIHYKGLEDGPDFDFVLNSEGPLVARVLRMNAKRRGDEETPEMKKRELWRLLLENLGILGVDSLESLIVDYLRSGLVDPNEVGKIVDGYKEETKVLEARRRASEFYEKLKWRPDVAHSEILAELHVMSLNAAAYDMFTATALHDLVVELPDGEAVAREFIRQWIAGFRERYATVEGVSFRGEFNHFRRPLHPDIHREVCELQKRQSYSNSILQVCSELAAGRGFAGHDEEFMKSATAADYESAILSATGCDLKIILEQSIRLLKDKSFYQANFGSAIDSFPEACRRLMQREDISDRLKFVIRAAFVDEGRESDLNSVVALTDGEYNVR